MNSFLISPLYDLSIIIYAKNICTQKKGSLGVPRTLWVLTPSLCVTNPLTCNLWNFISFDLKTSYLWVLFVLFPFFLGNNKSAVATLILLTLRLSIAWWSWIYHYNATWLPCQEDFRHKELIRTGVWYHWWVIMRGNHSHWIKHSSKG